MIRFAKAHAYGNDFLYVEQDDVAGVALTSLAREICDRHTGVGADGLVVYGRTAQGATMRLFNADGGTAEVSGNGVRGLAALLLRDDDTTHPVVTIGTEAGAKDAARLERSNGRQTFRTAMGAPVDVRQVTVAITQSTSRQAVGRVIACHTRIACRRGRLLRSAVYGASSEWRPPIVAWCTASCLPSCCRSYPSLYR